MERFTYFEKPTQLKFRETDCDYYVGGIGYHDVIICGCCGVIEMSRLYDDYEELGIKGEPIIVYENNNWVDISDAIMGDD